MAIAEAGYTVDTLLAFPRMASRMDTWWVVGGTRFHPWRAMVMKVASE